MKTVTSALQNLTLLSWPLLAEEEGTMKTGFKWHFWINYLLYKCDALILTLNPEKIPKVLGGMASLPHVCNTLSPSLCIRYIDLLYNSFLFVYNFQPLSYIIKVAVQSNINIKKSSGNRVWLNIRDSLFTQWRVLPTRLPPVTWIMCFVKGTLQARAWKILAHQWNVSALWYYVAFYAVSVIFTTR